MPIFNCQSVIDEIDAKTNDNLRRLERKPAAAGVRLANSTAAAGSFFAAVKKSCEKFGIQFSEIVVNEKDVKEAVDFYNQSNNTDGIIVERPCRQEYKIVPHKDIEKSSPEAMCGVLDSDVQCLPSTSYAIYRTLIKMVGDLTGLNISIINRTPVIGIPLFSILSDKNHNATVTVCHEHTKNLEEVCQNSDVIITAVGRKGNYVLNKNFVNKNSVVIDAGFCRIGKKIVGDAEEGIESEVKLITPVPGGVGIINTSVLTYRLSQSIRRLSLAS